MTPDDEQLSRLEEQWREEVLEDERMRASTEWSTTKPLSSRAFSRARQGRPSGRRLHRSVMTHLTNAAGRA